MTIVAMYLDPNAQAYSDDEIVGKVNAATANITRAGSVTATARPLVADEVTDTELSSSAAKDNLDAMADLDRGYIKTDPASGQFKIVALQRHSDGTLEADYDDVAEL